MKRFLVKSVIGIGRDFKVFSDEEGNNKVYEIDAKMGVGSKAEIKDGKGQVIYVAKSKLMHLPKQMEFYTPDTNKLVATLTKHFSPIRAKMTMELADGSKWKLAGNFIGKNYQAYDGDKLIVDINQKWVTVRDKYFAEIAEDADIALALGLIWTVDIWREGKNN